MHDLAKESHEKQDKSHVVEEARVFAELMEENKRWNEETARIRSVSCRSLVSQVTLQCHV